VCPIRVACNSTRRGAEGDYEEKPNYFDVNVYGASADNVSRYMRKGSRVAIDGRLEWREWETSEQQKRQAVSVVAETVLFLDSPGERRDSEPDDIVVEDQGHELVGTGDENHELVGVGAGVEDDDLIF
jgi:single-strand DNA-binding protein